MRKISVLTLISILLSFGLVSCDVGSSEGSSNEESSSSLINTSSEIISNKEDDKTNIKKISDNQLTNDELEIIKWEGRHEYKEKTSSLPGMMMVYHTATGFTIDFYGSELKADFFHAKDFNGTLDDDIYYDVKIDDEVLPNTVKRRFKLPKNKTRSEITIVNNLKKGRHTATILKMNEPRDGYTGIVSISTDGYFFKRDKEKDDSRLKIMAVCASGGSGYGSLSYNEKSENYFSRTRVNSSSLHSFNYLTARCFDADISFVAQAGWGVTFPSTRAISKVIDKCGITPTNSVQGALTTGDWNYQNYIPDIIIFNIGGNDTPSSEFNLETYEDGVVSMVSKLHTYYPEAKMLWTHTNSKAGNYAINALKAEGIISQGYIKQCVIPGVGEGETGSGSYGASDHASLKTHIDSSNKIIETLSRWGYEPVREQINFEDFEYLLEK